MQIIKHVNLSHFAFVFQELKEDNRVLQETKEVLEDQLEGWRARSDKIHQLEKHSLLLKARVHDMEQVRPPEDPDLLLKRYFSPARS